MYVLVGKVIAASRTSCFLLELLYALGGHFIQLSSFITHDSLMMGRFCISTTSNEANEIIFKSIAGKPPLNKSGIQGLCLKLPLSQEQRVGLGEE